MKNYLITCLMVIGLSSFLIAQDVKKPTDLQLAQAQLVKLQMEFLELQKQLATCQQGNLASTAKTLEEGILKTVEAKPGQKFDWSTLSVTPIPAATAAKP